LTGSQAGDDRRFKSPADGLLELERGHEYWSERVTEFSFHSSIGLIAANWALHSEDGALLKNGWAILSVSLAIAALLAGLFGAWLVAGECRKQYYVAVADRDAWKTRWEASERIDSEWPFTIYLSRLGSFFRLLRAALPILGGFAFVVGALN
jgi:hypothetical protein